MSRFVILSLFLMSSLTAALCTPSRFVMPGWWGGAEYLTVWRKQRYFPALATTSPIGTLDTDAGILGLSTTSTLFGNSNIVGSAVAGLQGDGGMWLTRVVGLGLGAYCLGVEKIKEDWFSNTTGAPILARPYFNVTNGQQAAELAAYPNQRTNGNIQIDTTNRIWGYDLYGRLRRATSWHVTCDLLAGFCYTQLVDSCDISTTYDGGGQTFRSDNFSCLNNYYAGMVGFDLQYCYQRLRLDVTGKVGLGKMFQEVEVEGTSVVNNATYAGGLLALPSNIGTHYNNLFEIGSILDAHVRYSLFGHLYLSVGYKLWYFPKITLAGEVISLQVNPTQQNGGALTGLAEPTISFNNTPYWTQSAGAGFYFIY